MNRLPAELQVAVAEAVPSRLSRISLSMITKTWRNTVAHLVFDSVCWNTAHLTTSKPALATFLDRFGYRIKHVDLIIEFSDDDEPDHDDMDRVLSAFASTPALTSLAFCARSSGRARHEAANEISRITYPAFCAALEKVTELRSIVYTEYCRFFGGRFARLILRSAAPRLDTLILHAPMLCRKLEEALGRGRVFPVVRTLELHDSASGLDEPSDVFPSVENLTVRSEYGASAAFPAALVQAFAPTLRSLALDSVGCADAVPSLHLPALRSLHVNQSVPAILSLFVRTPVTSIVIYNASQAQLDVLRTALRGPTNSSQMPYARLDDITVLLRPGRRADRIMQCGAMEELAEICEARGIDIDTFDITGRVE